LLLFVLYGSVVLIQEIILRVLSGIQPSGKLHIGNYFGAMRQHLQLQAENEGFYFIADYHALTTNPEPRQFADHTLDVAKDYLALGLDPEKTVFWRQSDVPEVTELAWILSCITPMGLLQRCTSFKDKVEQGLSPVHGLFAYPVLQAADILMFDSNLVPVGQDQKQHIEVTRDIAAKFNNIYGETFVLPEEHILKSVAVVPGIDGRKMSKSYDNTMSKNIGRAEPAMAPSKSAWSNCCTNTSVRSARNARNWTITPIMWNKYCAREHSEQGQSRRKRWSVFATRSDWERYEMHDDEKLVSIAEFENSFDAELAKVALDNAGIRSTVLGEDIGIIQPYTSTLFHVELQVFEKDAERAKEVLAKPEPLDGSKGDE
jgi:tryptophanyl-tRNA synthetase